MAKINFYEIKVMKFAQTDAEGKEIPGSDPITIDSVHLQISKKVNLPTMNGEKAEAYIVPVADIPVLFQKPDTKFPNIGGNNVVGYDCTARIAAVKKFLDEYIGKPCYAEDILQKNKKVLTYIDFNN